MAEDRFVTASNLHLDLKDAKAAAVPDPRFRDQLAKTLAHHAFSHVNGDGWTVCLCGHVAEGDDDDGSHAEHQADVIAAEVEARIHAANERTDELLRQVADLDGRLRGAQAAAAQRAADLTAQLRALTAERDELDRQLAAALAQPAPGGEQ